MKRLIVLLLCLGLGGCATVPIVLTFEISVDSINNNEVLVQKSCVVTSGLKEVPTEDLQFKEYATYVKRALTLKGYILSEDMQTADIVVFLGYGIGEPKEYNFSYAVPIFGQTGISSANTMGNAFFSGNSANLRSTTTYTPTYGVVGSGTRSGTFVTYTRQISLVAYDMKFYRETKKEKQLWKTEIISTGYMGDLRYVFPMMIGAASKYIGENTGKKVDIAMREDSKEVLEIKGINPVKDDSKATRDKK